MGTTLKEKIMIGLYFISRHAIWIIIGLLSIYILGWEIETIRTILLACIYESLAIALSSLALYAYTHIRFTKRLSEGNDGIMDRSETANFQRVVASVFVGVHLLVAIVVLGSQFLEVDKAYSEKEKAANADTCKVTKPMSTVQTVPVLPMSTIPEKTK